MLSFPARLTGPLPVRPHPQGDCAVHWGHLEPVGDDPILVGLEPFGEMVVLHVDSVEVLELLMESKAIAWAGGLDYVQLLEDIGAVTWPTVIEDDGEGELVEYFLGCPVIAGRLEAPDDIGDGLGFVLEGGFVKKVRRDAVVRPV